METKTVIQKTVIQLLSEVAISIDSIYKSGKNKGQHYTYATIEDLIGNIRMEFFKAGLILQIQYKSINYTVVQSASGSNGYRCELMVDYTIHGPAGDSICYTIPGESLNFGDKSCRVAATCALKIFLLQAFLISTTDEQQYDADESNVNIGKKKLIATDEDIDELLK